MQFAKRFSFCENLPRLCKDREGRISGKNILPRYLLFILGEVKYVLDTQAYLGFLKNAIDR